MRRRTIYGMTVLAVVSLLPLLPWYFLGPVRGLALSYANITHSLGQIAGLVGMTMLALTLVLSTRLKLVEKLMGGLDKVYVIHRIFGSIALMLLLLHPIMLVLKFIPSSMDLAARYLLPGHGISVDLGIIALAGLIILLGVTLYVNIRYHYWKMSHKFLGLFFIFAVLHIFLVRGAASRDYIFQGYYIFAGLVSAVGLMAFLYTLLFKSINPIIFQVKSINDSTAGIYDIELSPVKKMMRFKAGQFAFFRFHNRKLGREYHPFSIASPSDSKDIRVIIKSSGDYTSRMKYLKVGDKASVEGPYGGFTVDDRFDDMVWIGAGIGITPFIALAKDAIGKDTSSRISLYYCARNDDDFVAMDELISIEDEPNVRFKVVKWCSSEKGRMNLGDIGHIDKNTKIYICGPGGFKASMMRQLIASGISKENIFEEEFDLR